MHLLDPRTPEAQAVIEHQAVELCRRGVAECDVDDFKQEICLELWSKRQKYEPSRAAPITYMGLLARNRIASIFREKAALKRGGRARSVSLESVSGVLEDGGRARDPNHDRLDLVADVRQVLDSLPPRLREMCLGAMETGRFDRQRTVGGRQDLEEIKQRFIAAGLPGYLVGAPARSANGGGGSADTGGEGEGA